MEENELYRPAPGGTNGWDFILNHQTLIGDRTRTLLYKKAIEDCVKRDDVVMDMGCGTGILSFFAAKKGCKKVYAVDRAAIIDCAKETAARNGLAGNIEFVKADILKFRPPGKIDVLIQEQIGRFIWNDDLIAKVSHIRDRYLARGGTMIPFKIELFLAPVDYKSFFERCISFWRRKRYGIDFSNVGKAMFFQYFNSLTAPLPIELKSRKTFLCAEKLAHTIDLRKDNAIPKKITASFRLKKGSTLTGMCCYFKVYLNERRVISTCPRKRNTCWEQIFLPCTEKKTIQRDSRLNFTLFPAKDHNAWKFEFAVV